MPAMGEKRVAAVYNPDTAKLSQKSLDLLEKYLSDPSPTSVLVIYFIGKGIGNSSASKKLTSLATKSGSLLKLDRLSRGDLIKILCKGAANRGCSMSSGVASLLLDYCGDDLNTLNRELEKLRAYAGNRQITDGDIKLLCPKSIVYIKRRRNILWEARLAKRVKKGRYSRAAIMINNRIYKGLGHPSKNRTDELYLANLKEKYCGPDYCGIHWDEYMRIIQKAVYSSEGITVEECFMVVETWRRLEKKDIRHNSQKNMYKNSMINKK